MENKKHISLRSPHTEEEIEELKKSATEVRIPAGITLDEVVEALAVFKNFNQNIYMTFGDGKAPKFYSCDTTTLDNAYIQVYGCTRNEYWENAVDDRKNRNTVYRTSKEKAKTLIPKYYEEGIQYMYPERFEEWRKRLEFRAESATFDQKGVEYPGLIIECLKRLENGEDFQTVLNFIKEVRGDIGLSAEVFDFSKVGPEFFEYVHEQQKTGLLESDYWKKQIADKKSENSRFAKLHSKSPLQQRKEQRSLLEAESEALSEELKAEQTKEGQNIGEE